jgi:hypothetical protein
MPPRPAGSQRSQRSCWERRHPGGPVGRKPAVVGFARSAACPDQPGRLEASAPSGVLLGAPPSWRPGRLEAVPPRFRQTGCLPGSTGVTGSQRSQRETCWERRHPGGPVGRKPSLIAFARPAACPDQPGRLEASAPSGVLLGAPPSWRPGRQKAASPRFRQSGCLPGSTGPAGSQRSQRSLAGSAAILAARSAGSRPPRFRQIGCLPGSTGPAGSQWSQRSLAGSAAILAARSAKPSSSVSPDRLFARINRAGWKPALPAGDLLGAPPSWRPGRLKAGSRRCGQTGCLPG